MFALFITPPEVQHVRPIETPKPAREESAREEWMRVVYSDANLKACDIGRKLAEVAEMIEEWTDAHGDGCDCLFCAACQPEADFIKDTLDGFAWAVSTARGVLDSNTLNIPE